MAEEEEPPRWFKKYLESQMSNADSSNASEEAKRPKPSGSNPQPQKKPRPSCDTDSEAEFDQRFGHLFEHDVCDNKDESDHDTEDPSSDLFNKDHNNNDTHSEGEESVDEDLVEVLHKVPNWDASSSIRKFISKTIDRPLPEDMIKTLNEDYIPSPDLEEFFTPPKLPKRLYKAISRMKSKCALKVEQNLYSTQAELFVIAKPLVAALIDLKPLGPFSQSSSRALECYPSRPLFYFS